MTRRLFSGMIFYLILLTAASQDTLYLKTGTRICGKIVEINDESVKYKSCSNPDGPTYIKDKGDIVKIRFQNGEFEDYDKGNPQFDSKEYDLPRFYTMTRRNKKVYIECEIKNADIHAENYLKDWGFWQVTENPKDADFILKFLLIKSWFDYFGFAQFIDPNSKEIIYQTKNINTEWNMDINSKRGAVDKIIRKRIRPLYES